MLNKLFSQFSMVFTDLVIGRRLVKLCSVRETWKLLILCFQLLRSNYLMKERLPHLKLKSL